MIHSFIFFNIYIYIISPCDGRLNPAEPGWQICGEMSCHSSQMILFSFSLLTQLCGSTFSFKIPPKVFYLIPCREQTWPGYCFWLFSPLKAWWPLLCWKIPLLPTSWDTDLVFGDTKRNSWCQINILSSTLAYIELHMAHCHFNVSRLALCSHSGSSGLV